MKTAGTLNFYAYAGDDPVNGFDVDGLAQGTCPDQQAVLDSICGPNAEGEVHCTVTAGEEIEAEVFVSLRENAIRIAPHIYNTPEHVSRLIEVLSA